jgi:cation diffusion facilitator family transporter
MYLPASDNFRLRLLAVSLSMGVGAGLMALKFYAAYITGSPAIFSDALESIINVVASTFALVSILWAARHPDETHPYGHGKVEYFAAGFEGALIVLAAAGIVYKAWPQLMHPAPLPRLESGLLLVLLAALLNLALGLGLVRAGRRTQSLTLAADGQHVLSDVYTSLGVVAGLVLVWLTGWYWLDGAVAILVAANILFTDPCEDPICPVCGYDPCKSRQHQTVRQRLWHSQVITAGVDPKENALATPSDTEFPGKAHN